MSSSWFQFIDLNISKIWKNESLGERVNVTGDRPNSFSSHHGLILIISQKLSKYFSTQN